MIGLNNRYLRRRSKKLTRYCPNSGHERVALVTVINILTREFLAYGFSLISILLPSYSSLASMELGTEKAFREKSCSKISAIICMGLYLPKCCDYLNIPMS
ncbi:hypothetical protein H8356DRAFT_1416462 [Neocallimastix lanati (nom. inval.)]|nr:hypothetical protein H8356DRAFT_1416462 [Neocallimastix sp. JGI-2020a]